MKKLLLIALSCLFALPLGAQEPYAELGAKLEEYFTALAGEDASAQAAECDFLIASCQDSLVRQYVALKIYDHYLRSKIMGDDAVAVHVAKRWFLSGDIAMQSESDLFNARLFADFNAASLIGEKAPELMLSDASGALRRVPARGEYSVLYFYDTSCATCKLESARLKQFVLEGQIPARVFAIYTGADKAAWEAFRAGFEGAEHLWDPEIESDWQRLYGVLQTPRMFLVNPGGVIVGRGLDTPALRQLLSRELSTGHFVYGEQADMDRYSQLFAAYGDSLKVSDVMDVADYLAARTFGEGNIDAFKQTMGDLLYYLSSRKTEVYRAAVLPFVGKYIRIPDVWTTDEDKAQVVSLADMLAELVSRTPAGSPLPALAVHGVQLRKPCLFSRGRKEGVFSLDAFKGRPGYVIFYSEGCSSCEEILAAARQLVRRDRRARVLLVDMDHLLSSFPEEGQALLDSFDLSALPMVVQVDGEGLVTHKYVAL